MAHWLSAATADQLWLAAAAHFTQPREFVRTEGRNGPTLEMLHVGLSLGEPRERWIVSREPPLNPAFALAEVIWILAGRRDAAFLTFWNSRLPEYVGTDADLHGAYGYRLRNHFGIDQLERAYDALTAVPDTRQVVLQFWDPAVDLPSPDGSPASTDVPCNVVSLLKLREGRLEWMQVMRSNDLFRGLPYNIVQFTVLQEVLAGWLGVVPGSYNHLSDSLHVYESDLSCVQRASTISTCPNSDRYALSKSDSQLVIRDVARSIERLIANDLTLTGLNSIESERLPEAYANMLLILGAETARRRMWWEEMGQLADRCNNPALRQLWDRWLASRAGRASMALGDQ